jgi:hypothetical protein
VTEYELWVHPHLTPIFAVRLTFGQVTGVCPLLLCGREREPATAGL